MYAFAQHSEFEVLDEPFYAHYLDQVKVREPHPMEDEILTSMPKSREAVVAQINALGDDQNLFVKNMAHHCLDSEPNYMANWHNVILIRHPKKLLASFSKVIERPSLEAIGLKKACELADFFDRSSIPYLIIESDQLMVDPPTYLEQMCDALDLVYEPGMCQWPKGGIAADGIWAPHWYGNVHQSTGFIKPSIKRDLNHWNEYLESVFQEALPYYQQLHQNALINKQTNVTEI